MFLIRSLNLKNVFTMFLICSLNLVNRSLNLKNIFTMFLIRSLNLKNISTMSPLGLRRNTV